MVESNRSAAGRRSRIQQPRRMRRSVAAFAALAVLGMTAACSANGGGSTEPTTGSTSPRTEPAVSQSSESRSPETQPSDSHSFASEVDSTSAPATGEPTLPNVPDTAVPVDIPVDPPLPEPTPPPAQERLPVAGPATIAGVDLGPGHVQITDDVRLLWLTDAPNADAGAAWRALYAERVETGLWPLVLFDDGEAATWPSEMLYSDNPGRLNDIDALETLQRFAGERAVTAPAELAAASADGSSPDGEPLPPSIDGDFAGLRIGLVEADDGATALSRMGWLGPAVYYGTEDVAAVIASWQDRFGAVVVGAGAHSVTLVFTRPPSGPTIAALANEIALMNPDQAPPYAGETLVTMRWP